jgi:hypothetical protein
MPTARSPRRPPALLVTVLLLMVMATAGCATSNPNVGQEFSDTGGPAGFFYGLLHGILVLPSFIVSLFSDTIGIYEVNNTGFAYDAGYLLGLGGFIGGGVSSR